jgi:hypothetical protein
VVVDNCTAVVLRGLTVSNGRGPRHRGDRLLRRLISKCRVENVDGEGISMKPGDFHMVQKCRFTDTASRPSPAATARATSGWTSAASSDTGTAITFRGDGHIATRNRVKDSQNEGFVIQGTNCDIEKNVFDGVVDDALDVEGDDKRVLEEQDPSRGQQRCRGRGGRGRAPRRHRQPLVKNSVSKVLQNGIFFAGSAGNTFVKNKAKQAGGFGLLDTAGPDANYYEKNHFGTKSFE